jgi:predicted ATP-grasp superfamily ATP-dependent carboligase
MNHNFPAIVCDSQNLSQIAIIQELGKHNIPVIAISDTENAIGNASKYIIKKYIWDVPSYSEEYIQKMIDCLERGVIFYSNDPNVENISDHKQKLISSGFKVIVADRCILDRVIKKENLYITAQECSVKVPKTSVIHSYDDLLKKTLEIEFPFILKANNFAGGIYCFVSNKYELQDRYKIMQQQVDDKINLTSRPSSLLIQEWIPQDNIELWNLSAFVQDGDIISYSMGKRIRTNFRNDGTIGSTLLHGATKYNKMIFENNSRLFKHLNYDGLVETEWSLDIVTNEIYLYDFNPRPSGNIRWALNSGLNINQFYRFAINIESMRTSHNKITQDKQDEDCNGKNLPLTMCQNIKYYKIFYEVNDFVIAVDNPKLSFWQKVFILAENLSALLHLKSNVIDILDIHDLNPTLRASKRLPYLIIKGVIKLFLKPIFTFIVHSWGQDHDKLK